MSSKIDFQIIKSESVFLDPRKSYEPTTMEFQVRVDPLTGRTGHFSHFGAVKPQKLDLESYDQTGIKGFCPFCPKNREKATPKFTKDIFTAGRSSRGEATIIPNLFPYDVHSSVLIMTDEHVVPIRNFSKQRLLDAFSLGIEFLKKIHTIDSSLPYHLMTWNYMPPSGGGIVHPHQQYFATAYPGNQFMDELRASEKFHQQHDKMFWLECIGEEQKREERYIGQIGNSHWLSSFVCFGFLGDLLCVFPDAFSIDDFTDTHIDNLVSGMLNIFRYYESAGVYSFNVSLFFGPVEQNFFPCHFRITPRTFLNIRDFAPDMNFFQTVLAEPICLVLPEELCREVKPFFA
ncbi:MAG: hypothetical protein C0399_11700 [Syntrophus sp. (in: bacteria)]|nr:hypothetical protein [Syntrophus sp. (in: bacteria)]